MNMPENTRSSSSPAVPARRALLRQAVDRLFARGPEGTPPDIDELWRDFTRKLGAFFGFQKKGGEPSPGGFQPDAKSARIGIALVSGVVVVVWLFSGSFIVQEGQKAVVTTFGKYTRTVDAGWGWRWPYPIQANETVDFMQPKSVEIGGAVVSPLTGVRDSAMLTQDQNIVDVRFTVQYRLKDERQFLFTNRDPAPTVVQAASSAVREIVGRWRIDEVLAQHDLLAAGLMKAIQAQLDHLETGILVANVSVQSVAVPERVSTAFDDVAKAAVDNDRLKKEAQAYATELVTAARSEAAHMHEDALAYKARVVSVATGDAERFKAIDAEYQKAPGVTRDRLYIDAMQEVYANTTKVLVDTRGGTNVINLPLDKLAQAAAANAAQAASAPVPAAPAVASLQPTTLPATPSIPVSVTPSAAATPDPAPAPATIDARSRDNARSRDRDGR